MQFLQISIAELSTSQVLFSHIYVNLLQLGASQRKEKVKELGLKFIQHINTPGKLNNKVI